MYKGCSVAVVVPAYNEERFIGEVIRGLPDFVDSIIVVDDCSTDGTSAAVQALSDRRVTLLRTEANSGVGGAMALGYREALARESDIVNTDIRRMQSFPLHAHWQTLLLLRS